MDSDKEFIRFKPFLHKFISYDGTKVQHTFTCPKCGGHSCKKVPGSLEPNNFWSGHWVCLDCGNTKDNEGKPICYYSDCFIRSEQNEPVQLELF